MSKPIKPRRLSEIVGNALMRADAALTIAQRKPDAAPEAIKEAKDAINEAQAALGDIMRNAEAI
jgi:hypothetical protein